MMDYFYILYPLYIIIEASIIYYRLKHSRSLVGTIKEKRLYDDFDFMSFIYLVEFLDKDSKKKYIRTRFTNGKKEIGSDVRILEVSLRRKTIYIPSKTLWLFPLFRVLIIGAVMFAILS